MENKLVVWQRGRSWQRTLLSLSNLLLELGVMNETN